jgi:hypothetical protein
VDGNFVHFAGAVDRSRRMTSSRSRGRRGSTYACLDVYVGIDPGIARGGVVWCGFDRDNVMLVFDELYPENKTVVADRA